MDDTQKPLFRALHKCPTKLTLCCFFIALPFRSQMGATIVDAIDTLHIMGLMDEYQKARDWIATQLNFDIVRVC